MKKIMIMFFIVFILMGTIMTFDVYGQETEEVLSGKLETSPNEIIAWIGGVFGTFIAGFMLSIRRYIVLLILNKQREVDNKLEKDKHNKKLIYTDMFLDFLATVVISAEKSEFNKYVKDKDKLNKLKREYVEDKVKNELPSHIAEGLKENSLSSDKLLKENLHHTVKKVKSGRFHLGTFLKDIGTSYIKNEINKH